MCFYYNSLENTCTRSVVAASPDIIFHDYANFVRKDPKRCGPKGAWFVKRKSPETLSITQCATDTE